MTRRYIFYVMHLFIIGAYGLLHSMMLSAISFAKSSGDSNGS